MTPAEVGARSCAPNRFRSPCASTRSVNNAASTIITAAAAAFERLVSDLIERVQTLNHQEKCGDLDHGSTTHCRFPAQNESPVTRYALLLRMSEGGNMHTRVRHENGKTHLGAESRGANLLISVQRESIVRSTTKFGATANANVLSIAAKSSSRMIASPRRTLDSRR